MWLITEQLSMTLLIPKKWQVIVFIICITVLMHVSLMMADPLIKVCDSGQYKRIVEDTCSSVYKRGRHSKIVFNSYGWHRSRTKSKF